MKKPKLNYCVTLKFKKNVASFFVEMADTFPQCSYKMTVDSTGSTVVVKITCSNSMADVLIDTFPDEFAGVSQLSNCPLAGIK